MDSRWVISDGLEARGSVVVEPRRFAPACTSIKAIHHPERFG